jgi:hypothetical protein
MTSNPGDPTSIAEEEDRRLLAAFLTHSARKPDSEETSQAQLEGSLRTAISSRSPESKKPL